MTDTKTTDLLRQAAEMLAYCSNLTQLGDSPGNLANKIQDYLRNPTQDHWSKLKDLADVCECGSYTTVSLWQTDLTKTCWIRTGDGAHSGRTFEEALAKFDCPDSGMEE
jgi:hypothetical protein